MAAAVATVHGAANRPSRRNHAASRRQSRSRNSVTTSRCRAASGSRCWPLFLLPFHLQRSAGAASAQTGLTLLVFSAALMASGLLGGLLADRYGARRTAAIGATVVAVGLAGAGTARPGLGTGAARRAAGGGRPGSRVRRSRRRVRRSRRRVRVTRRQRTDAKREHGDVRGEHAGGVEGGSATRFGRAAERGVFLTCPVFSLLSSDFPCR
ncbi:hypothetical protein [Amycolatopsis arida]|uniref:hypothetical protein n=1 Tax=Amycolatopsis arida TaxID=587909 RepID=UPI001065D2FA|nr:hypothetical protein [Amycolatopsis arida]